VRISNLIHGIFLQSNTFILEEDTNIKYSLDRTRDEKTRMKKIKKGKELKAKTNRI
jgi:hypothetical protein